MASFVPTCLVLTAAWLSGLAMTPSRAASPGLPALHAAGPQARQTVATAAAEPGAEPRSGRRSEPTFTALERLRRDSRTPVGVAFANGFPRRLTFDLPAAGGDPVASARAFLASYPDLLRLSRPVTFDSPDPTLESQLLVRGLSEAAGEDLVVFYQTLGGLPVIGAGLVVGLRSDPAGARRLSFAAGALLPPIQLDTVPAITPSQAADIARAARSRPGAPLLADPFLTVFDPGLGGGEPDPHTAWSVALGGDQPYQILVDANTEELLLQHSLVREGAGFEDYDLDLEDANGGNIVETNCFNPTTIDDYIGDEDGVIPEYVNDPEAAPSWWHWRHTYAFYHDRFGRHSFDDDDGQIETYVYSSNTASGAAFVPGCESFEFATGFVSFDVTVHEFTHAVIADTSQLVYQDQSGALNESFSDVMGAVADDLDWLIAEDRTSGLGAIRSLEDPVGGGGQPDRMSNYCSSDADCVFSADSNGVHTNSGIPNKAAFLMAEGGSFNGVAVAGMGRVKLGHITYALMCHLPSMAQFADARELGITFAETWAAQSIAGFTSADVCTIRNAWAAVEVGFSDEDCDGIEDDVDDSDNDGILDPDDNCNLVPNPLQFDFDQDGIGDLCDEDQDNDDCPDFKDNCPFLQIPCTGNSLGALDTDGDGFGNPCDDDDDGDGILDPQDNCQWHFNPDQFDGNNNGEGDACDPDLDGDGLYVEADNCTFVPNPAQIDSDGDGLGDACDDCPSTPDNANAYTTGFPELGIDPEPLQPDSDGDGIPDACDPFAFGQIGVDIGGQPYSPIQGPAPDGRSRRLALRSTAAGTFHLPLPICSGRDAGVLAKEQRIQYVADGLPEEVDVWVSDELGSRVAVLSEGGPLRGLRFGQDCRRRYYLNGTVAEALQGPLQFTLTGSPVAMGEEPAWATPSSGAPPPPVPADAEEDGQPDSVDNCPFAFNPAQTDSDGDGFGDACDLCRGDDRSGDLDGDGVCAALDCDDGDPTSPHAPACGPIFLDGFESGDVGSWSRTVAR